MYIDWDRRKSIRFEHHLGLEDGCRNGTEEGECSAKQCQELKKAARNVTTFRSERSLTEIGKGQSENRSKGKLRLSGRYKVQ